MSTKPRFYIAGTGNPDTPYGVWDGLIGVAKMVDGPFKYGADASAALIARMYNSTNDKDTSIVEKSDEVAHPAHYTSHPSGVECITITRHMNFNLGNATKYIWRAGLKGDDIVDLEKAAWYLQDEIARRKGIR
jgi:hypothetical protein